MRCLAPIYPLRTRFSISKRLRDLFPSSSKITLRLDKLHSNSHYSSPALIIPPISIVQVSNLIIVVCLKTHGAHHIMRRLESRQAKTPPAPDHIYGYATMLLRVGSASITPAYWRPSSQEYKQVLQCVRPVLRSAAAACWKAQRPDIRGTGIAAALSPSARMRCVKWSGTSNVDYWSPAWVNTRYLHLIIVVLGFSWLDALHLMLPTSFLGRCFFSLIRVLPKCLYTLKLLTSHMRGACDGHPLVLVRVLVR